MHGQWVHTKNFPGFLGFKSKRSKIQRHCSQNPVLFIFTLNISTQHLPFSHIPIFRLVDSSQIFINWATFYMFNENRFSRLKCSQPLTVYIRLKIWHNKRYLLQTLSTQKGTWVCQHLQIIHWDTWHHD